MARTVLFEGETRFFWAVTPFTPLAMLGKSIRNAVRERGNQSIFPMQSHIAFGEDRTAFRNPHESKVSDSMVRLARTPLWPAILAIVVPR